MSKTLGDELPKECARVRELIGQYREVSKLPNVNCTFAIAMMEQLLRRADAAMIQGDTVEMIRVYKEMKECE